MFNWRRLILTSFKNTLLCKEAEINFLTLCLNTLRPRQNGRHFADDTFKCIFVNENVRILIEISLNFVPEGPINNIPALVQIMAPMMVCLPTHICVTRPQWVKVYRASSYLFVASWDDSKPATRCPATCHCRGRWRLLQIQRCLPGPWGSRCPHQCGLGPHQDLQTAKSEMLGVRPLLYQALLTHCRLVMPDGTKPLPEPILVLWHSPQSNFTVTAQVTILNDVFENYTF